LYTELTANLRISNMKLFGSYTSPYVRHCRVALFDLGITFDFIDTDYTASAMASPAMRVPFLHDNGLQLSDSSSILMHVYHSKGIPFIETAEQMELYALSNTAMDTTINLFFLEKDNVTPQHSAYLKRQSNRIDASLAALELTNLPKALPLNIAETRLACYLDWALFRKRISLDEHPNLLSFVKLANTWPTFADTAPPK
jgi:glutathione S-transferase